MAKKLLALVLSMLMLVSLLPVSALAYENNTVAVIIRDGVTQEYTTLREAVDKALADETVYLVADDTVSFTADTAPTTPECDGIIINKNLTIDGQNHKVVGKTEYTYDENVTRANISDYNVHGFFIKSGDVTIKNLTMTQFGDTDYVSAFGLTPVLAAADYSGLLTLSTVTISKYNSRAIALLGGTLAMDGCTITGDAVGKGDGFDNFQQAVSIYGSGNSTIANSTITGIHCDLRYEDNYYACGIVAFNSASIAISDTSVTAGARIGSYQHYGSVAVENAGTGTVTIAGGSYSSDINAAVVNSGEGTFTITAGTFSTDPTGNVANGYVAVKNSDTKFVVTAEETPGCGYAIEEKTKDAEYVIADHTGKYSFTVIEGLKAVKRLMAAKLATAAVKAGKTISDIKSVELVAVYKVVSDTSFEISPALAVYGDDGLIAVSEAIGPANTDPNSVWTYSLTVPYVAADDTKLDWTLTSDYAPTATGETTVQNNTATVTIPHFSTLTLTPHEDPAPDTYTVRVDFNGGLKDEKTFEDLPGTFAYDAYIDLSDYGISGDTLTPPTAAGVGNRSVFDYWLVEGNKIAGDIFTMLNQNVVVTAVWKEVAKAQTVTYYNTADDTEPIVATLENGVTYELNDPVPVEGKEFKGWKDQHNAIHAAHTNVTMTEDYILTGQWTEPETPPTYTVTTAADPEAGGTVAYTITGDTVKLTYTVNPGYSFDHYTLAVERITTVPELTEHDDNDYRFTMPADNVTATGHFTQNVYTAEAELAEGSETGNVTLGKTSGLHYGDKVTITVNAGTNTLLSLVGTYKTADDADPITLFESTDVREFTMPEGNVTVTASFGKGVASVTHGGSTTYYAKFEEALAAAKLASTSRSDTATIKLLADAYIVDDDYVEARKYMISAAVGDPNNITLDLNGKTLTNPKTFSTFYVWNATLTVMDSTGGGKIINTYANNSEFGGAIVDVQWGYFALNGGTLVGGSHGANQGAVYVQGEGTFDMIDGEISGSTAKNGGGVYVDNGATFNMWGGKLTGNTATEGNGGGVYVAPAGTFVMNGGLIGGADASGANSAKYGGGVYLDANETLHANFTMKGGWITQNTATTAGGGVFANNNTEFTLSGTPSIIGNTANGAKGNVHLTSGATIKAASLTGGEIGVTKAGTDSGRAVTSDSAQNKATYFKSDDTAWGIKAGESEVVLVQQFPITVMVVGKGTLTADVAYAAASDTVKLEFAAAEGYTFDYLTCNDAEIAEAITSPYEYLVPAGVDKAMTFTAYFKANGYTVEFNANVPTGASTKDSLNPDTLPPLQVKVDETYKLSKDTKFALTGYTFKGWDKDDDGTADYEADQDIEFKNWATEGTVTLKAIWEPITYFVRFNPGENGQGTMADQGIKFDEKTALNANTFTSKKEGFSFKGWATASGSAEIAYANGADVLNLASVQGETVDLYAVIAADQYTLTVVYNGATNKTAQTYTTEVDTGAYIDLEKAPFDAEKTNYKLDGWYVDSDTTKVVRTFTTMPAKEMRLDAIWVAADEYHVYVSDGVSTDAAMAKAGVNVTLTITTPDGKALDTFTLVTNPTGDAVDYKISGDTVTFVMPASDVSARATFKDVDPEANVVKEGVTAHGSFTWTPETPADNQTVTVTVTPNPGYSVKEENGVEVIPVTGNRPEVTKVGTDGNVYTFPMTSKEVTVNVYYTADAHIVTFVAENGTVTTEGAADGKATKVTDEVFTVTATPADGYERATLTYTLASDTETVYTVVDDTITMPADDITVTATFTKLPYTITASVNPEESGTVEIKKGETTVNGGNIGDVITVTFTPATGYELDVENTTISGAKWDGEIAKNVGTFTMEADNVAITASFKKTDYTIMPYEKDDGTVAPSDEFTAQYGDEVALTVTEVPGFVLVPGSIKVYATEDDAKTVEVTTTADGTTFNMPAYDVTVDAEFKAAVAMIGEGESAKYFLSLGDAIDAANAGNTIKLLASDKGNYNITKSVTLNTNGYTVTGDTSAPVFTVSGGTFTLTGSGAIAGTDAGTGVSVAAGATFAMDNGKISGFATGVLVEGEIELSGSPYIVGNDTANVDLAAGKTIAITDALTDGAKIGVTSRNTDGIGRITAGFAAKNSSDQPEAFFTSDNEELTVIKRTSDPSKGEAELIFGNQMFTITINGNSKDYISADREQQAKGNPVAIKLEAKKDDDSFLTGIKVTTNVGGQDFDVTDYVNPTMTLADDGTFNGATFDMYGADVTVSAVWASKSVEDAAAIDAAKDSGSYKGVFLPDGNYVIQEAAADDSATAIQDDFTALAAAIKDADAAGTIVLHTANSNQVFTWDETTEAWKSGETELTAAIAAAGLFDDGKTVNLVLDGAPLDITITVADDVVTLNGAKAGTAYPAVIVTPVDASGINAELDKTQYKGIADVAYAVQVDVYANNNLVHPVTLTAPITFKFKDIPAGTYFVGNNHKDYVILEDTENGGYLTVKPDENSNANVTASDFTMYFLGVADTHQITTVVNEATMGTLTTTPTGEAAYGENVEITVNVTDGYHLESLTYAVGSDSTYAYPIEENKTAYTEHFTMPAADVTVTATFAPNTYKVTLKTGYGGSLPEGQDYVYVTFGDAYPALPTPTTQLQFTGWTLDEAGQIELPEKVATDSDHNLYAQYEGKYVAVTYVANEPDGLTATGTVDPQHVTAGGTVKVRENAYVLSDDTYRFAGWYTAAVAGDQKEVGADLVVPEDTILYAHWEKKVTLSYDANLPAGETLFSGVVPNDQVAWRGMTEGVEVDVASSDMVRTGYKFEYWSTAKEAGTDHYTAGETYKLEADTTLYAIWTKSDAYKCVVYFDTDGGSEVETWIFNYPEDQNDVSMPNAVKANFRLQEWRQTAYGTGDDTVISTYTPGSLFTPVFGKSFVMTAYWVADDTQKLTVTFDKNGGTWATASQFEDGYYQAYYDETFNLPIDDDISKQGYVLNGWTLIDGSSLKPGDLYQIKDNVILKADWAEEATNATIETETIKDGTYGVYFNVALEASTVRGTKKSALNEYFYESEGGADWEVQEGKSMLPAGLTLSQYGVISGIPTETGKFTVYIGMRKENGDILSPYKTPEGTSSVKKFEFEIKPLEVTVDLGDVGPFSNVYGTDENASYKELDNLKLTVKNAENGNDVVLGAAAQDIGFGTKLAITANTAANTITFTYSGAEGLYKTTPDTFADFEIYRTANDASTSGYESAGSTLLELTVPTTDPTTAVFTQASAWSAQAEKTSKYFYTVEQKKATATWHDPADGYEFTGSMIAPTAEIDAYIVEKDSKKDVVTVGYEYEGALTAGEPINVGAYTATAYLTGKDAANYYLLGADANYNIIARSTIDGDGNGEYVLVIEPNDLGIVSYNGEAQEPKVVATLYKITDDTTDPKTMVVAYKLKQDVDFTLSYQTNDGGFDDNHKPLDAGYYVVEYRGKDNFANTNYRKWDFTAGGLYKGFQIERAENAITKLKIQSEIVYGTPITQEDGIFTIEAWYGVDQAKFLWYTKEEYEKPDHGVAVNTPPTNVGEYYLSAVIEPNNKNYKNTSWDDAVPFKIVPKPIKLIWTGDSFVYNGSEQTPTVAVDPLYVVTGDTAPTVAIDYCYVTGEDAATKVDPINANGYTAVAKYACDDANYTIADDEPTKFHEFTISQKSLATADVTITPAEDVYDATVKTPGVKVEIVLKEGEAAKELVYGTDYDVVWSGVLKDANTYTATISGINNFYSTAPDATFTILPATVTVTGWSDVPGAYRVVDDAWVYLYGVEANPTPIVEGLFDGDDCQASAYIYDQDTTTISTTPLARGTHRAEATLIGPKAGNYVFAASTKPLPILVDDPSDITVTITVTDAYKFVHDAEPDLKSFATLTTDPAVITSGIVFELERVAGENVGTYAISLKDTWQTATQPYTITSMTLEGSPVFTIKDKSENHVWVYALAKDTYDGDSIKASCTVSGCNTNYMLTIVKPALTKEGGSGSASATLTGKDAFTSNTGASVGEIEYYKQGDTTKLDAAPTTEGQYTAKVTTAGLTAEVNYTIAQKSSGGGGGSIGGGGGGGTGLTMELIEKPNGTINFEGKEVTQRSKSISNGETVKLEVKPAANYKIDTVTYTFAPKYDTPQNATEVSEGVYQIVVQNASIKVTATFKPINDNDPRVGKVTIENYTNGYADCDHTDDNCPLAKFDDLKGNLNAWYHDGIHYCLENGIMQGFGDAFFRPNDITTRAQVVTTLWNIAGHPIATSPVVFSDVSYGDWYYDAIMWAAANGIVEGYGDGKFGPNDEITHEQMAKIFYGYAAFYGFDVSAKADITGMPGYDKVSDWAIPFVEWAVGAGVCCGKDGNVSLIAAPEKASRAELATFILNFCTKVAIKPAAQQ